MGNCNGLFGEGDKKNENSVKKVDRDAVKKALSANKTIH
jgi:hypothetical protein